MTWGRFKAPYFFITSGKVGTHTTNHVLASNGWKGMHIKDAPGSADIVGLIRHPIDRWLSVMAMILYGGTVPKDIDQLVDSPIQHSDLSKQSDNFSGNNATLFRLENIKKLWSFLGIIDEGTHLNKCRGPMLSLSKQNTNTLLNFYADDLVLWKEAK